MRGERGNRKGTITDEISAMHQIPYVTIIIVIIVSYIIEHLLCSSYFTYVISLMPFSILMKWVLLSLSLLMGAKTFSNLLKQIT